MIKARKTWTRIKMKIENIKTKANIVMVYK